MKEKMKDVKRDKKMSITIFVDTKIAREDINKGDYLRALVQISADLEYLFFWKLFFEKEIKTELIENWTLRRFIDWVCKLNLIDIQYEGLLRDFNKVRNGIIHRRYAIHQTTKDLDKLNLLANLMIKVCDFLDSTPIERKQFSQEQEDAYEEVLRKMREKYEKVFTKKK